jgi:hypothetical protein
MGELRRPSYLSLWMSKHGRPDQIRVDFRQTASGAVSWVILAVTTKHDAGSIEVQSAEIGQNRFDPEHDVYLAINHCSIVDWTDYGRRCLDAWVKEQNNDRRTRRSPRGPDRSRS